MKTVCRYKEFERAEESRVLDARSVPSVTLALVPPVSDAQLRLEVVNEPAPVTSTQKGRRKGRDSVARTPPVTRRSIRVRAPTPSASKHPRRGGPTTAVQHCSGRPRPFTQVSGEAKRQERVPGFSDADNLLHGNYFVNSLDE